MDRKIRKAPIKRINSPYLRVSAVSVASFMRLWMESVRSSFFQNIIFEVRELFCGGASGVGVGGGEEDVNGRLGR